MSDHPTPREELEMRLTALLLGELSAEEAASLQEAMQVDPELNQLHDQLKQTIGLVREVAATPAGEEPTPAEALKLSNERRDQLLASFKTVTPEEWAHRAERRVRRRELALIAAMIVGLLAVASLLLVMENFRVQSSAMVATREETESEFETTAPADQQAVALYVEPGRRSGRVAEWNESKPALLSTVPGSGTRGDGVAPADRFLVSSGGVQGQGPAEAKPFGDVGGFVAGRTMGGIWAGGAGGPGGGAIGVQGGSPPTTKPVTESAPPAEQPPRSSKLAIALPTMDAEKLEKTVSVERKGFWDTGSPEQAGTAGAVNRPLSRSGVDNGTVAFDVRGPAPIVAGVVPEVNYSVPLEGRGTVATEVVLPEANVGQILAGQGRRRSLTENDKGGLTFSADGASLLPGGAPALTPPPVSFAPAPAPSIASVSGGRTAQQLNDRLDTIRLESFQSDSLPLEQVAAALSRDVKMQDPSRKGINFIMNNATTPALTPPPNVSPGTGLPVSTEGLEGDLGQATVRMPEGLKNPTLRQVLDEVVKQSDRPLSYSVQDYGIVLSPQTPPSASPTTAPSAAPGTPPGTAQLDWYRGESATRATAAPGFAGGFGNAPAKDSVSKGAGQGTLDGAIALDALAKVKKELPAIVAGGSGIQPGVSAQPIAPTSPTSPTTTLGDEISQEKLLVGDPAWTGQMGGPAPAAKATGKEVEARLENSRAFSVVSSNGPAAADGFGLGYARATNAYFETQRQLSGVRNFADVAGGDLNIAVAEAQRANAMGRDAKFYYEASKLDQAESKLREALKSDPQNEATRRQVDLVQNGRPATATLEGEVIREKAVEVENAWNIPVHRERISQPLDPTPARRGEVALGGTFLAVKDTDGDRNLNADDSTWQMAVNDSIPRTGIVEQRDQAAPESKSLWGTIRDAFGGRREASTRVAIPSKSESLSDRDSTDLNRNASFDPYFVQTEAEKVQSKAVLGEVVEQLKLNETWGGRFGNGQAMTTEDATRRLQGLIEVRQEPNSQALDVRVKAGDAKESAVIANAVADVYAKQRAKRNAELEGLAKLERKEAKPEPVRKPAPPADANKPAAASDEPPAPRRPAPNAPVPQPEVATADNAFSTFSLNVSDVSFKLAAASLEKGQMPDVSTVRTEEFINALDYHDPEPTGVQRLAFHWERARYPFAHNRDLVRFSVKTAASGRQPGRPLNLVLLLDNSGSMERADRIRIRQECLRVLASQLRPEDRVSVVAFARTPRLWVDGVPGNQAAGLSERVGSLTPEGGTNLEEAMNLAYQTARRHFQANGVNRVVLLTDGAANLGEVDPAALKLKVESNREQGVALDCFGIGWDGYNDDLLESLSRNGDGRYGFVNTPGAASSEFAGQLAGALRVAASDVKVQVQFNPGRVTAYRQMGYAKHQLKKEQFRDNTVDAAEIGAAEAGNALYVVEVNPNGEGPLGVARVRFKVPGTQDYREQEWTLSYDGGAKSFEQAPTSLRLAGVAAAFSEWLVASPFAAEVTPGRLQGYLSGVPEKYAADPRPKELGAMLRQAGSLAGK